MTNISVGRVPHEEGTMKLQSEVMSKISKITMKVEKNNTLDNVIHAFILQLALKASLNSFGNGGGCTKINATDT